MPGLFRPRSGLCSGMGILIWRNLKTASGRNGYREALRKIYGMRLPCHDGQQEDMRRGDILRAQGRELRRQRLCLPGAGGRSGVCGRGQSCPSRRSAPYKGGGRFCGASGACRASPYPCLRRCPAGAGAHRHQRQDDHEEPDIPGARREIQGRLYSGQPQQ